MPRRTDRPTEAAWTETALRSAGLAFVTQMTTAAFTAALTLVLVRALSPEEYGRFALAVAMGAVLAIVADLGISASTARFIAERSEDPHFIYRLLRGGLRLKLLLAGLACAAFAVAADPISDAFGDSGLVWPIRIIAAAAFSQTLFSFFASAFGALGRVSFNLRLVILESAVETAASIGLVVVHATATSATAGRATGYAMAALFGLILMRRFRTRAAAMNLDPTWRRSLMRYALALLIIDAASALFEQIDVILIGALLSPAAVGLFQVPFRLATFLVYPAAAIAAAVAPRVGRRKSSADATRILAQGLRAVVIIQTPLAVVQLVWAGPVIDLVAGPEYADAVDVFRALAGFTLLMGPAVLLSLAANFLGEARRRLPAMIVALLVNAAVDIALLETLGPIAAVIGTLSAYLIYVPVHFHICARQLQLPVRALGMTVLRASAAGAVMAGCLAFFGVSSLSLIGAAAGATLAAVVYGAGLLALGELRQNDLAWLPTRVRRAVAFAARA